VRQQSFHNDLKILTIPLLCGKTRRDCNRFERDETFWCNTWNVQDTKVVKQQTWAIKFLALKRAIRNYLAVGRP